MPHTERARRKAAADSKARRALIDPDTPRPDMGPRPFPSDAKLEENLERAWEQGQRSGASRCFGRTTGLGKGSGSTRHRKDEY